MFLEYVKLITASIIFFVLTGIVNSQTNDLSWEWQNPMPNGNDLHGIKMLDENNVVVVGGAGLVMKTTNAGNYWSMNYKVADIYWKFNDVFFVDDNTGWAVGEGDVHDDIMVIAKTTDSGNTWERQNTGGIEPAIPIAVFFVNYDTGYVAGENGKFLRTTNGGTTWEEKLVWGGIVSPINDIFFTSSKVGWAVSQSAEIGLAFKTNDAGETWALQFSVQFTMFRTVFMVDAQVGYVGGMGVYRTTNGGLSWEMTPASPSGSVRDMHFFNHDVGLTVGADYIWRTTNGGTNWIMVYPGQENIELYSVAFIDDLHGFVSGARGMVLKTTDGGLTWSELTNIQINIVRLDDVHFIDREVGVVVGDDGGKIFRTSDGGATWNLIESGITTVLRAVEFIDENTGIAVGRYGVIRRTTDGGLTWTNPQLNQATEQLFGLHLYDENFGCAVGENTIVTTTDGGLSWYEQTYTYPEWVMGVHFISRQKGFAVGMNGKIFRTTDEGATWTEAATIVPQNILRRVSFADELNGVAVGDIGTVARTTDGGETWYRVQLSEPYINSLFAISFVNDTDGYASGDGGMILKTTDAGATWVRQASPTMHRILGMHFLSENEAVISGAFGQILRTSNLTAPSFFPSKTELVFVNVPVGSGQVDSLIVYNWGNALLEISNIYTTDSSFSVYPSSATVPSNEGIALSVEFIPDRVGTYEAELIFTHNGFSSPDTVLLIGDAVTNVSGSENYLPVEYKLHQNFPNPFNPETMINFDIPRTSNVNISVYNTLGERVAELLNTEMNAGYHKVSWNADQLPSGIYLIRLRVDDLSFVKKSVLIK